LRDKHQFYKMAISTALSFRPGGNVTANFTDNISNTSTTANAGGVSNTITAPSLNTLSNQSIGGSVARQTLAGGPVAVNSPQWQDQLQNALQQITGGGSLDNGAASGVALTNASSQQKAILISGVPAVWQTRASLPPGSKAPTAAYQASIRGKPSIPAPTRSLPAMMAISWFPKIRKARI
jgi:hypothetical protein